MRTTVVKAAINGGWGKSYHPATPIIPSELAEASRAAAAAGADFVHFHPRTGDGEQSIRAEDVDRALLAIREVSDIPVGITTGLWCCGNDPGERYRQVAAWRELPDFASVAFSEQGAAETANLLVDRGIVLESAVWTLDDVPALLASPTLARNTRILIEPLEEQPDDAVRTARAIAGVIREAGVDCPLLYHGDAATVWPVLRAAIEDSAQVRIGLEDGKNLPDGSLAADNDALIRVTRREIDLHAHASQTIFGGVSSAYTARTSGACQAR
ncbi:MAG TPA: 3-keto-5-aminohexanoate cleavage protein [Solirubrobacteraceae bacterium]